MTDQRQDFLRYFLANQQELYAFLLARGIRADAADDVLQEVAMVLWRKFDDFELGTNFRAWAFQVARFELQKQRARWTRSASTMQPLPEDVLVAVEDRIAESEQDMSRLRHCLDRLSDRARDLIDRVYHRGHDYAEITADLGCSVGSLRTRLSRIRQQLAQCLQNGDKNAVNSGENGSDRPSIQGPHASGAST